MTKQLFLCLMACSLAITPVSAKRFKVAPEQMNSEQLEKERKKYKTRGIGLTTAGSVATAGALTLGIGGTYFLAGIQSIRGVGSLEAYFIAVGVTSVIVLGGGIYMLGQGIHDLAKAKKLRRIQMKKDAQARRLARQNTENKAEMIGEYAS